MRPSKRILLRPGSTGYRRVPTVRLPRTNVKTASPSSDVTNETYVPGFLHFGPLLMQMRLFGLTFRLVTAGAMKSPGAPPTRTTPGCRFWLPDRSVTPAGARSETVPASPFSHGVELCSVTEDPSGATLRPPSGRSLFAIVSVKSSTWTLLGSSGSLGWT